MIVTTGGEAELGAVGGGVSLEPPEPPGPPDDEAPGVAGNPPPLVPAADFEPLLQAVASTATIVAEAARRVIAATRRFPPLSRIADVRM
ncbi:hypothetical protein [Catenulispora yoronensis]|uniref:hypothetical protein n=1 Tax=Catenulispora yoronensis TaxID=450799 RepID=UPI0031D25273